ncbi:FKBP-type peptidyl-prolyl cis-trans isomerase [Actinoplanes sp. KI2]|uniref:FKBP-type peptidyl-prolyl cis-trans isomerase n=1 Tax=Actinoplanes sp. KI2 TaxID=2983315 RepID=UPI0021D5D3FB|nr:FKBP-type peptidyl-prolyl cis-trans isomerase [Actinoplanes sp. KI2]MCU7725206.1 FKBP-type peptidyl-prolyl cis-trans isomerase [Actinoplanes sp. KI2]
MSDSVEGRSSDAAKRAAAPQSKSASGQPMPRKSAGGQPMPRKSAGGQPIKTKAEKRAEAKAAKARARAAQKRRQALTVGGVAAVVVALLVGLVVWIGHSSSSPPSPGAATASAEAGSSPAPTASSAAFPPVPPGADPALSTKPTVTAGTGTLTELKTTTLIKGKGAPVQSGQTVTVNYVGATYADGKEFDSSWSRKEAFSFPIGAGRVIPGWDKGLIGVPVGSRVQLDIPADLAYGDNPGGGQPAGALRFVVDVLAAS